jgi:peptidoglycan-N-acetylglucosamine deacetylase
LYIDDAAHAAPAPRTTEDMSPPNLRTCLTTSRAGWRAARAVLPAAGVAAAVHAVPAACALAPALRRRLGVRDDVGDPWRVALTFDDGPHPDGTPAVLETLRDAGAPATFFLVGEQVARHPGLASEVAAAGHEIALHCQRHRNLLRLAPWQVRDDLARAEDVIAGATGRAPRLYRPPYGVLTGAALAIARRHGWEPVLWSRWGRDWRARASATSVAADAAAGLAGGEILLLHDADHYAAEGSWRATAAALPRILDLIDDAGLEPGRIP